MRELDHIVAGLVLPARGRLRDDREGFGEEPIPCQHRDAFSEDDMSGGLTAAQIVVVHAGQVVVHEGVGVDDLNRTGGTEGVPGISTAGLRSSETENGPEALAAREDGVAHGLVDRRGMDRFTREETTQCRVDLALLLLEIGLEVGHGGER